jgi:hypothetical protein
MVFLPAKKIHPDFWDEETATANRTCPDGKLINSYITKTRVELERCYNQLAGVHDKITAAMIKKAYIASLTINYCLLTAIQIQFLPERSSDYLWY